MKFARRVLLFQAGDDEVDGHGVYFGAEGYKDKSPHKEKAHRKPVCSLIHF